jgi:hypothetical protein
MSDPATSATVPLVSRLPGAFYYDRSFDHTTFLNARQVQRHQPLHIHTTKATLRLLSSVVLAVSSSLPPSSLSLCRSHGGGHRNANSSPPRVPHQVAVPLQRPIVAVTSTTEPSPPMHPHHSSNQTQTLTQNTHPSNLSRRNLTLPPR